MRWWKDRTHGAGMRAIWAALGILVWPGEAVEAQTLFPPLYRLQGGSPAPAVEKQPLPEETPWRPVTPDQVENVESAFPVEDAGSEGPIFDLDLLR